MINIKDLASRVVVMLGTSLAISFGCVFASEAQQYSREQLLSNQLTSSYLVADDSADKLPEASSGKLTVSLDAIAIPAGFMGDHESITISDGSLCYTGSECTKIEYMSGGDEGWAGVLWWPEDCDWPEVEDGSCGINLLEADNFSKLQRLTFWAKGEQGGEVVKFGIGGKKVWPRPGRFTKKITLSSEWEPYTISLEGSGTDVTNVTAPFLWVADEIGNPKGAVFYLDDVQFEGIAQLQSN